MVVLHPAGAEMPGHLRAPARGVHQVSRLDEVVSTAGPSEVKAKSPTSVHALDPPHCSRLRAGPGRDGGGAKHRLEAASLDVPTAAVGAAEVLPGAQLITSPRRSVRPARSAVQRAEHLHQAQLDELRGRLRRQRLPELRATSDRAVDQHDPSAVAGGTERGDRAGHTGSDHRDLRARPDGQVGTHRAVPPLHQVDRIVAERLGDPHRCGSDTTTLSSVVSHAGVSSASYRGFSPTRRHPAVTGALRRRSGAVTFR